MREFKPLGIRPATHRMLKQRQIPAFKVGSDWRFNSESIDRWRLGAEDTAKTAEKTVVTETALRRGPYVHRPMR